MGVEERDRFGFHPLLLLLEQAIVLLTSRVSGCRQKALETGPGLGNHLVHGHIAALRCQKAREPRQLLAAVQSRISDCYSSLVREDSQAA